MPEQPDAKVIPLGERLRLHRTERGLSQAQAARELEVARTAYRLWEMEAAKPSPDRWRLIAGPDDRARWSLAIVAELASRWGGGHQAGLNIAWFEIDIPA